MTSAECQARLGLQFSHLPRWVEAQSIQLIHQRQVHVLSRIQTAAVQWQASKDVVPLGSGSSLLHYQLESSREGVQDHWGCRGRRPTAIPCSGPPVARGYRTFPIVLALVVGAGIWSQDLCIRGPAPYPLSNHTSPLSHHTSHSEPPHLPVSHHTSPLSHHIQEHDIFER
jgi:hypothetical protein